MSRRKRLAVLAAAALSAVLLALVLRGAGRGAQPAPPVPPPAVRTPEPPRRKPAVKKKTAAEEARDAEIERKKLRGSRLREMGEALGGDNVERRMDAVEKSDEKSDR